MHKAPKASKFMPALEMQFVMVAMQNNIGVTLVGSVTPKV